ncbi:zinc transport system substrate-binding protein [Actinokineospora baliensis]|uniref:ABC transporter substrate-binding protein n=1 Tax=Actinokineospora baliensis TaxID=547056 RepID=UPI0019570ECE|nr:ABC transporter substrate-binding protein [Actinokineospora baliensis]MBM7775537.1 zinc transport system substrate-binding protein [Actinokineospora baliensis]
MKLGIVVLGAVLALSACGQAKGTDNAVQGKKVVAATAWEGALAKAAGAGEVKVIVPASVVHAADYDPKPSDLVAVGEADLVLYAEFEGFAGKLKEAAGGDARVEPVVLDNKPDVVRSEVRRLADLLGTKQAAEAWITEFDRTITGISGKRGGRVVSQAFVAYMAEITGLEVVGTYGPQPITPAQVADLTAAKPDLVLDNAHMPTSGGVLPDAGAKQVEIVNYPGPDLDLLRVYTTNAERIVTALG